MKNWKVEFASGGETLADVELKRGIFQGDFLSLIFFVTTLIIFTILLRDMNTAYKFGESQEEINHLLFMDDLRLCSKMM